MVLRKRRFLILLLAALVIGSSIVTAAQAQDSITLSIALPDIMRNLLSKDAFAQFESDNPGVKVNVVYTGFDAQSIPPAANGLDAHLQAIQDYVSKADVVNISDRTMSVDATRAGYFLDLSPLTSADASLNVDDFIPTAWKAFQWDNGVWGLPVSEDVIMVIYNSAAFDQAGLAYPNEAWTMDDFINAAHKLAEVDPSGAVTKPGMVTFDNLRYLLRALTGQGFYDASASPDAPKLDTPTLESLLTTWVEQEKEGYVSQSFSGNISDAPLEIFTSFGLSTFASGTSGGNVTINSDQQPSAPSASLLPGGTAGISTDGFAISSGTQYPEQAYALLKYMTNNVQISNGPLGVAPARRSLQGVQAPPGGDGQFTILPRQYTPEMQAIIDKALANGFPVSELRYSDYVMNALDDMQKNETDAQSALQTAEASAVTDLQTAADQHATTTVLVATPVPEVVLQPGEIALNFGLQAFIQPMPNADEWDKLMSDFAASDPQVGKINLDTSPRDVSNYAANDDCFYLGYNAVPSLDVSTVLNLDPFLDADVTFDRSDMVGNSLSLVQKDNHTYALPIVIQPELLRYNSDLFTKANVPAPETGWTIDQFNDALHALKPTPEDATPFVPRGAGGGYLLQLMAAYGGIPLDERSNPPIVNFTDPTTVQAIRQVLDLAKEGYIAYQELARTEFNMFLSGPSQDPIYTEVLNGFIFKQVIGGDSAPDPYRVTTYPTGQQYATVSYDMGTAYISATTQNADACYRWISTIAQHPELFSSMPAHRSIINDPAFATSQGADTVAIYNQFSTLMSDPNTINLQSPFSGAANPSNFILEFWLDRAFDHYVLKDADLDSELNEAQSYAVAYQQCIANLPPFDATTQTQGSYFQQFAGCATSVDGSLSNLFPKTG